MQKMMSGWISLAFMVAVAYVSGNSLPSGCNVVTSRSFGNTSRPPLGLFCEEVNKDEHPNRTWIGINLKLPQCTVCCAGKSTTGPDIHYNVSILWESSCARLKNGRGTRNPPGRSRS
uniref:Ixostatin n=1 Tax=Rhipicephalus zambeziensis TaxID=60191 RepID=A0A224YK64_9ACAR